MADQKNIDQFFQKKLNDFEQEPRPEVWLQIEERLTKKKKRRVLPMWWYGGVAAVLIGLLLFPFLPNEKEGTDPIQTEPIITTAPINPSKETPQTKKNSTPTQVIKNVPASKILPEVLTKENTIVAKNNNTENPEDKNTTVTYVKHSERNLPTYTKLSNLSPNSIAEFDPIRFKGDLLTTIPNMMYEETKGISLFDAVKKNDSLFEEKDVLKKRWGISPSYGYLKTNSFSNGSSIDNSLNNNPVGGNENASFGVNVHFPISKNWGIRSGIHLQQLSFSTQDIGVASGISSNGLASIRSSNTLTSGLNNDVYIGSLENTMAITSLVSSANLLTDNAIILQRYGYVEFPIELTYSLRPSDRFSVGLISGISTLLLNDNEILVRSEEYNSYLGEANNLNPINVSVNFGFDLDYVVYKNWSLNVNPMLKVHLVTFTQNSNGFSPYFLGLYTGVKYQF
ncbi:hypothetical protein RQM59_02915 [Flavobacteriaceae bacterium S356]|uniref:Outer membrane protein beta-barrel domain-containing protein n=1 Tax=Asprobacillus argus TaxID=3076534 RepID=A0ABU3LE02_9FLAO|nr:hypothetical protein [Flavobacteriaceae bacterium S356]